MVQSYDKCIGSLTRRTMTDEYARQELYRICGNSGRATLLHLEQRGTGMEGSVVRLAAGIQLGNHQAAGVEAFTVVAWFADSKSVQDLCRAAGITAAVDVVGRLRMGLYSFPPPHDAATRAHSASAATPVDVVTAVAQYISDFHLGKSLLTVTPPGPPAPADVSARQAELCQRVRELEGHPSARAALPASRDPPRETWDFTHRPCRIWGHLMNTDWSL